MNIFSADSRWTSGLGDLGPIVHRILAILGPILTFALLGWFIIVLVRNILPLTSPDVSDEEKSKHKKNIFIWCISLGLVTFATGIVTILFFTLGKSASESTTPASGAAHSYVTSVMSLRY